MHCVDVTFATVSGSGGLVLDLNAACPALVLSVYCNDTELGGEHLLHFNLNFPSIYSLFYVTNA